MIEIIDMVLLAYIAVLESISVYKLYFKPKRKYNRKGKKVTFKVYSNEN